MYIFDPSAVTGSFLFHLNRSNSQKINPEKLCCVTFMKLHLATVWEGQLQHAWMAGQQWRCVLMQTGRFKKKICRVLNLPLI